MADADPSTPQASTTDFKSTGKLKPTKNLPTDRVGKETQYAVLRAYAKASEEQGRTAVSNADVARFSSIAASSISVCNTFFNDAGLLVREGLKQRPVDAVFAYDQAADWGAERPGTKLAPVLATSWFGKPLLAKLSLQSMSLNEALVFLADECRASAEYRPQIQLLLDYLEFAGLIANDGATVRRLQNNGEALQPPANPSMEIPPAPTLKPETTHERKGKRFSIPVPDKDDATIILPEDIDEEEWEIVKSFLESYVRLWKKWPKGKIPPVPGGTPP